MAGIIGGGDAHAASSFGFLRHPVVWLCFAFFFVITFSNSAIQNFSTPALQATAGLKADAGGHRADRLPRLQRDRTARRWLRHQPPVVLTGAHHRHRH